MAFRKDKKEEEDGGNPYQNLDKTSVLQEARTFNETPVNAKKCTHILTKILYLINQGETLGTVEATDAFFAMTKLFQSKDVILRRMVYLSIKELSLLAEDVIIVTSSLTKDMTGKEDMYRAAAIRALCSITDMSMLQAIERYMKQAIVDRNPNVSSAALVSSLHMARTANEVVKRWANEVQEALNSDNLMVQYHALGLLYRIRKTDRLAVTKLVAKLTKIHMKSPFAVCLLLRIVCKLLEEDYENSVSQNPLFEFVELSLRHKSEMVVYEAANAIVNLRKTTSRELTPAISVLQMFCSSSKATLRFAAVRTLNKVAMSHPSAITGCNMDLESLISDSNRSVATLAITTLLKTGAESSVDRLMKQIATFVNEISDEFKIVVIKAIKSLCEKYPKKYRTLMNFLSGMLREEGGFEYKAAIANTIIAIIEDNPHAKDTGLAHLCEFIEDCEHISLAVKILHLLGKEGPKSKHPSRYIRFIYNRVILESPIVRAAAVSSLGHFGATCPLLLPSIMILLQRCQMDTDDEVRDRATYYHTILTTDNKRIFNQYILEPMQVSTSNVEKALAAYIENPTQTPFDIRKVPKAPVAPVEESYMTPVNISSSRETVVNQIGQKTLIRESDYLDKLNSVIEIASICDNVFKTSEPIELTESETEYVVKCIKHCYTSHIVLQFECINTLNDQLLENVRVQLELPEGYALVKEIPCATLAYYEPGYIYMVLQFPEQLSCSVATFGAVLKFTVIDCDPTSGLPDSEDGYDEEYILEDIELTLRDQVQKVNISNFNGVWEEETDRYTEVEDTYTLLNMSSLEDSVQNIVSFLGMQPAERTDRVPPGKSSHTLYLAGEFRGGYDLLVRAKLALADSVTMQLTVRCTDASVADFISSSIG